MFLLWHSNCTEDILIDESGVVRRNVQISKLSLSMFVSTFPLYRAIAQNMKSFIVMLRFDILRSYNMLKGSQPNGGKIKLYRNFIWTEN